MCLLLPRVRALVALQHTAQKGHLSRSRCRAPSPSLHEHIHGGRQLAAQVPLSFPPPFLHFEMGVRVGERRYRRYSTISGGTVGGEVELGEAGHVGAPMLGTGGREEGSKPAHKGRDLSTEAGTLSQDIKHVSETLKIVSLVEAFRDRGHYVANLDPLGRTLGPLPGTPSAPPEVSFGTAMKRNGKEGENSEGSSKIPLNKGERGEPENARDLFQLLKNYPKLDLAAVGLAGINPEKRYFLGDHLKIFRATQIWWTVREIVALLAASYCGTYTVEGSHLASREQKLWLQAVMERPLARTLMGPLEQEDVLYQMLYADHFERFLAKKFPAAKRFGIEGGEVLIPGLRALLTHAARLGVESVELGMAHRGRLNVLHSVLGKPLGEIISEFKSPEKVEFLLAGDVKYHLGTRGSIASGNKTLQLSLSPNPSHLEAVDPVVVGKVRAKQHFLGDHARTRVMGLLLHGDAAFSGLGVNAEVLQLSALPEYTTGGTVHVIINNQIGFTTDPKLARSTPHCSDVAKAVGAPIFHVNADDPEAVAHVCKLAVDWRQRFHKDVVVDIVCYRRHGHNEQDDPRVTQPLEYARIKSHPTSVQLYTQRLLGEGCVSDEMLGRIEQQMEADFEREFAAAGECIPGAHSWLASNWQGQALGSLSRQRVVQPTGVPLKTLLRVGRALCRVPEGFHLHPQVEALLKARRRMVETGERVDWACAEALAFGSLMMHADASLQQTAASHPAFPVRLSGQDCERGTFNHRHAVLFDQTTAQRYIPLNNMEEEGGDGQQEPFMVCNSNLSEAAVLGFEYGFSLDSEEALVLWEAQFGDFANNAQMYIDNFIASGEDKWMTATGLVLLLPHGYDGQGPDHSSARLERFLQLCSDDPDHLPGTDPLHRADIASGFAAADLEGKGYLTRDDVVAFVERRQLGVEENQVDSLVRELGLTSATDRIELKEWELFMIQWMRRNAEKDHNLFVVNVTTPANYFHVLRRQVSRKYAKPLVVMSPKYLLHHKACTSSLSDMAPGTYFRRVIADGDPADNMRRLTPELAPHHEIQKLILCSGKVYYHLAHARRARKRTNVGLVRLEQIAPLAMDRIASVINRYPNARLFWVQEEPKNMGAWTYVQPRLATAIRELCPTRNTALTGVSYIGRVPSASAATGSYWKHQQEMQAILDEALSE